MALIAFSEWREEKAAAAATTGAAAAPEVAGAAPAAVPTPAPIPAHAPVPAPNPVAPAIPALEGPFFITPAEGEPGLHELKFVTRMGLHRVTTGISGLETRHLAQLKQLLDSMHLGPGDMHPAPAGA